MFTKPPKSKTLFAGGGSTATKKAVSRAPIEAQGLDCGAGLKERTQTTELGQGEKRASRRGRNRLHRMVRVELAGSQSRE